MIAAGLALVGLLAAAPAMAQVQLKPGDILVADGDADGGSGAVIKVDPASGQQTLVSSNTISTSDNFRGPFGLVLERTGRLLVVDINGQIGDFSGAVVAVNPATGQQTLLSDNDVNTGTDLFENPRGIALDPTGRILVADVDSQGTSNPTGAVILISPTGQQSLVSDNATSGPDLFSSPTGLAFDRAGRLLLTDPDSGGDTTGALIEIDQATAGQTARSNNTISGPDLFSDPFGLVLGPAGQFFVADSDNASILGVNPATGQQFTVSNNNISGPDLLTSPPGIALDASGRILVADRDGTDNLGSVVAIDRNTGQQSLVSDNTVNTGTDLFDNPNGILVVPPRCFGQFPAIVHLGTARKDVITGTGLPDVIVGLGAADTLRGMGGADRICGGRGRDRIVGGKGRDRLSGEGEKDRILGGAGADRLLGGKGRDRLIGGKGRDRLRGGPGRDLQRQ